MNQPAEVLRELANSKLGGTRPPRIGRIIVAFIILGLAIWIGTWWIVPLLYGVPSDSGQFGDMFGAVNALFSGAALAFVVGAIFLQQYEIRNQIVELKRTADAQTRSEIALREQCDGLRRTVIHSALTELVRQYSSDEMGKAVASIRTWGRHHAQSDKGASHNPPKERMEDNETHRELYQSIQPPSLRINILVEANAVRASYFPNIRKYEEAVRERWDTSQYLHQQRRLVRNFYRYLAVLIQEGVLARELVFRFWPRRDLEIIPRFILPADLAVSDYLQSDPFEDSDIAWLFNEAMKSESTRAAPQLNHNEVAP